MKTSASVPLHNHVANNSATLCFKEVMSIASINVNCHSCHIDEIRLVKDLGIHILAVNESRKLMIK